MSHAERRRSCNRGAVTCHDALRSERCGGKAYAQVFQVQDDRGSSPTAIPAVNHPLYGPSAQPAIALQALHFHHATITTPAVPPPSEPFPWEVAGPDSFLLQARGTQKPLYDHLTREVYDACLSQFKTASPQAQSIFPMNCSSISLTACMHCSLLSFSFVGSTPKHL